MVLALEVSRVITSFASASHKIELHWTPLIGLDVINIFVGSAPTDTVHLPTQHAVNRFEMPPPLLLLLHGNCALYSGRCSKCWQMFVYCNIQLDVTHKMSKMTAINLYEWPHQGYNRPSIACIHAIYILSMCKYGVIN